MVEKATKNWTSEFQNVCTRSYITVLRVMKQQAVSGARPAPSDQTPIHIQHLFIETQHLTLLKREKIEFPSVNPR